MPKTQSPVVKAIKQALPAVISITMTKKLQIMQPYQNPFGMGVMPNPLRKKVKLGGGSGFIIDKTGIVLTNRHVIEDPMAEYLVILQDGQAIKPEILAKDPIHDIAVLKIKPPKEFKTKGFPVIKLGDSSKVELGEEVIAIGNALGLFANTVSTGVISGLSREIRAQSGISMEKTKLRGLIQTDAAINPGNSGGPLIDLNGQAIGINAAMVYGAENIGFAMPINNAKKDLSDLKKYGHIRQPFLGVRYMMIDKMLKQQFGLPVDTGALVVAEPSVTIGIKQAIVPGSPAHKAGLKEADIILEANNKKIDSKLSVTDVLQDCKIGQKVPLKVLRKGKPRTLHITLAEKK